MDNFSNLIPGKTNKVFLLCTQLQNKINIERFETTRNAKQK